MSADNDLEASEKPLLRLRITHITSTMSTPLPTLSQYYIPPQFSTAVPLGSLPHHMPVIRIFGTTPSLQKICANIHLCYPYFYVPYPMDSTDPLRPERVVRLCQRFAVSLNHAICLAMRQNPTSASNKYGGGTDPKHLHVVSVMLVKGTPFYGYHVGYNYFLKVSLVNPQRMYVALEQLRKPAVLGREWQPHEAHMNHVLQFMCDFDLYGCGWLDLSGGTFREPLPEGDPYDSPVRGPPTIFNTLTVPADMIYPNSYSPPKDTYTPLEIDILPNQILNRNRLKPRGLHQDFVELLKQPLDPNEKLVPAVAELWEDERRRRADKGLSLSEEAMMPGSGMGGRSMEELGYKVPGKEVPENTGGNWKISEELWGMLEERMGLERRRKGRLTFERFSGEIRSGKDGEKTKYDKWVMTTFEAVSAHWPKLNKGAKSTQKSKRSRKGRPSSAAAQSSPLPHPASSSPARPPHNSSPVKPFRPSQRVKPDPDAPPTPPADIIPDDDPPVGLDDVDLFSSDEEEEEDNPFHLFAMTQAPNIEMKVEVDSKYIAGDTGNQPDEDDEEQAQVRRHAEDVHQRAEAGRDFRATQAPPAGGESEGEYNDEELDALFRKTVTGGLGSTPSTPRRRPVNGGVSMTPTTRGSDVSGGSMEGRRDQRERRMRELAGWGDLSTIMDRSSVSLTPPTNPYDDRAATPRRPRTPTGPITPVSDKATPTSMVRNLFAKNGPSPLNTPSKRSAWPPANTVVLPPSKRSVGPWSPSPEKDEPDESPSKVTPRPAPLKAVKVEVKSEFEEIGAVPTEDIVADLFVPGQQILSNGTTDSSAKTEPEAVPPPVIPMSSPTQLNEPAQEAVTSSAEHPVSNDPTRDALPDISDRPKKRVRMAGPIDEPENPFTPHLNLSQRSNHSQLSQRSASSAHSAPTVASDSTTPSSNFAKGAWQYHLLPPTAREVAATMESSGIPTVVYQEPYYSNPVDIPPRPKMFAGRMFSLKGNRVDELTEFEVSSSITPKSKRWLKTKRSAVVRIPRGWEYGLPPPRLDKVVAWCHNEDVELFKKEQLHAIGNSQLTGPTQKNRFGFKFSQKKKSKDAEREAQNMSVLCIEVFSKSRHQLLPDPEKDDITAIFFCYQNEDETLPNTTSHSGYYAGYAIVDGSQTRDGRAKLEDIPCTVVDSELDLINWLIDLVKGWDPDVLAGWELHNASWGYVTARAQEAFSMDLTEEISRVVGGHTGPRKDFYSATHTSTFKVSGRHVLNVWRICRAEVNLTSYSFENVSFHLLHQRIPRYSAASLTALWKSKTPEHTARVLKYFFQRVVMYCEIIDAAEIITKNAEFARVFGVDFASVMFRGSQFKVESFMFRIAKPESFVLVSPSKQQVGLQNAPFAVPLIAEPESKYYTHPILVLDFQSLYPSIMIAYNICYSTCLGRVEKFKGTDKFGFTELKVADGLLELLKDYLTVTPNGMIFVKPAVRKSLLAKMLGEILDTRVMVKQGMKGAKGNKTLHQLLNARQLGLKLMANVTYGYTSATYSGRMPCIEVADSIVQTGRETLEKAQELIHSRPEWAAQVVYGDTDSLFVALPGRSKDQAFKIGNDIADAVTAMNPKPVKLKFEKVYMGSVLMAKKRYVGFKYEHPDETEPVFDAKGIETIRRDGFPAQQKIEEVCLKMLFRNQDLSEIKDFCRQEWTKILQGRVSAQEFIVAKEVRLGSYSDKGVPPPGAAVAYRRILKDPRDEPQYAERVPYIVSNADGRRLIDRARMPEEMLANRSLGIDAEYYIRNLLIPPLSRIFNLVGADVENWYDSMPRTKRAGRYDQGGQMNQLGGGKMRIDSHFKSSHCVVCGAESSAGICKPCTDNPSTSTHAILSREHLAQEKLSAFHKICASCSGTPLNDKIMCDSIDCPLTYARTRAHRNMEDLVDVRKALERLDLDGVERRPEGPWAGALEW